MNWGATGFLILFAAFILLLIFNPNLSCFGKRVRSPFYPLFRKRRQRKAEAARKVATIDYGFHLSDDTPGPAGSGSAAPPRTTGAGAPEAKTDAQKKARDYGFKLD
jgi:hypothetical protein